VVLVTALTLRHEYRRQITYWQERLSRVADANQRLLENWVKEREQDARLMASLACAERAIVGRAKHELIGRQLCQQHLLEQLNSVASSSGYAGAYFADRSGQVVARSDASPPLLTGVLEKVKNSIQPVRITIPLSGGRSGYCQVAFVIPVLQHRQTGGRNSSVIGHLVLLTRPEDIASLLVVDKSATTTGETILLAMPANKPVYISPLHYSTAKQLPQPPQGTPGRTTLLEKHDFIGAYRDYRGVPVLAATRFLPDTGWAMVTKVDQAEALSAFRRTLTLGISLGILSILTIISVAAAWWRHERVLRLQSDLVRERHAEEDLRQSEARFLEALQNSPVVVFSQDRELRYTWINQPVPPWSETDYRGKTDEQIIGIADGTRLTALKRPVLESGIGTRKEWSFSWRGELRVYDINIQPLRNEAGEVTGITCASTDITERKRAEDRLHEYERAVEGLEEMIVVVDRNYRYRIANRAFLAYRGMQREQLIGRHIADVLSPGVFENVVRAKLDECLQGKVVTYEMKYTYPKLGERDLLLSYFPIDGPNGVDRVAGILQDVTERKRAEEHLREYEKVVEGLEEMIVVVDRNYRYRIANRASLEYRGVRREQLIGRHVADVLKPGVFEHSLKAKMDQCFQGQVVIFEMKYTYPRLGERDLLISYFPIEGPDGIDRLACILQDITDRKRAEKALRDSETRYRLLFERNPAGMFRSTPDGKLLEANETFARMFGYASREELLRFPNTHFYFDLETRAPLLAKLREQGHLSDYEFCGRHRDGTPVWVSANIAFVAGEDGAPDLLEGTFINVTGRKRAEADLQRSEAQLRAFMENAPYGIFRCAGNRFLSVNPALVKMLDYSSQAELLNLNLADHVFYPGGECLDLPATSAQQGEFGPVEVSWKRRDGALILVRLRGRVSPAPNGGKTIEAIAEDITQQRALEEYLNQSDRLEALGRLASGVAHDFNNLLLGITLNLEHVLQQSKGSGNLVWEDIEQALHAARNAAAVTRQLLVFGRKRAAQRQSVNLNDVVIRSQDLVNRLAGENIHVHLRLSPKLDQVLADPVQVQQVILNLVANARDAMAGQGQITIATRTTELQQAPPEEYFAAVPKAGTYVMLEVSDTGSGISREALTHIFEPFFTTKAEGSGLGLSTSYGIVSQSSGYISVRTQPGHGTTVRSYLPCQREVSTDN